MYYILDGGPCEVGVESTIVGMDEKGDVEILRKGGLSVENIEDCVGKVHVREVSTSNPEAPGMLISHYAPKVPLILGDLNKLIIGANPEKTGVITLRNFYPISLQNIRWCYLHRETIWMQRETYLPVCGIWIIVIWM